MTNKEKARNPKTTAEELIELAYDDSPLVRSFVAKHKNTPAHIIEKLVWDRQDYVSWAAIKTRES